MSIDKRLKTVPIQRDTVDMETGEVTETVMVPFKVMPPRPGSCPVCGNYPAHEPEQPHNAQSLYYQYTFYGEYGRWPTWKDAVAHCTPQVQAMWETELRGVEVRLTWHYPAYIDTDAGLRWSSQLWKSSTRCHVSLSCLLNRSSSMMRSSYAGLYQTSC